MDEETEREETVPFAAILQQIRKGGCHHELSEELANLVQAVQAEGKVGTLTLTLKVTPYDKDFGAVKVTDAVKVNAPKPENPSTTFFGDEQGNLTRSNPRQAELPGLAPVEGSPKAPQGAETQKGAQG